MAFEGFYEFSIWEISYNDCFVEGSRCSPLGENARVETGEKWPERVLMISPLGSFHRMIVL